MKRFEIITEADARVWTSDRPSSSRVAASSRRWRRIRWPRVASPSFQPAPPIRRCRPISRRLRTYGASRSAAITRASISRRRWCSICEAEASRCSTLAPTSRIRSTIQTLLRPLRSQWRAARRMPGSSSTAQASDPRSPRTRSAGSASAMCLDETTARYSREHNGANVLALGASLLPGTEHGGAHRRRLARHADARGAIHPAAAEDSPIGGATVNPQDLQRLIEIITEEIVAAQGSGSIASQSALRLSFGAVGLLSDAAARRARCRSHAPGPACGRRRSWRRVDDDRPHAA